MPLVEYSLEILKDLLDRIDDDDERLGAILTFSYPDLIVHPNTLDKIFGGRVRGKMTFRDDGDESIRWHKALHITNKVVDTAHLMYLLGYHMEAIDLVEGRGGEFEWDLNFPIPENFHEQYDLVFDNVSNQCFAIGQCMANAWVAVRPGGYVFHVIPCNMVNQGFWNVSPTAYQDFYRANNGELVHCFQVVGAYEEKKRLDLDKFKRCRDVPDDTINIVVARKILESRPIVMPVMEKFRRHPTSRLPPLSDGIIKHGERTD